MNPFKAGDLVTTNDKFVFLDNNSIGTVISVYGEQVYVRFDLIHSCSQLYNLNLLIDYKDLKLATTSYRVGECVSVSGDLYLVYAMYSDYLYLGNGVNFFTQGIKSIDKVDKMFYLYGVGDRVMLSSGVYNISVGRYGIVVDVDNQGVCGVDIDGLGVVRINQVNLVPYKVGLFKFVDGDRVSDGIRNGVILSRSFNLCASSSIGLRPFYAFPHYMIDCIVRRFNDLKMLGRCVHSISGRAVYEYVEVLDMSYCDDIKIRCRNDEGSIVLVEVSSLYSLCEWDLVMSGIPRFIFGSLYGEVGLCSVLFDGEEEFELVNEKLLRLE